MMQYLVEGSDGALTVLYQRSLICDNISAALEVGESVKYLWPEDSSKPKTYSGIIVGKDCKFVYLLCKRIG